MLKRHLKTSYNMTPEQYREKWQLPPDYPMVAPNYAKHRSSLAKKIGLGHQAARSLAAGGAMTGLTRQWRVDRRGPISAIADSGRTSVFRNPMESRIERLCVEHGLNTAGPGTARPELPSGAD